MVGRHTSFLVTKRSLRNSDSSTGRRPRRVIQTKNVDDTVGLSRREEQELNKALYASLQENRRSKVLPGFSDSISSFTASGNNSNNNISSCSSSTTSIGKGSIKGSRCLQEASSSATTSTISSSSSSNRFTKSHKVVQSLKHSVLSGRVSPKRLSRHRDLTASLSVDESSQDSVRSSASSHNGSKRKVHAQRKFAQGCSLPGMTSCTPVKFTTPAVKMLSSRVPKTEDFLTFLCLRGSSILPSHLDFFNFSLEEPPPCKDSSKPESYPDKNQREGISDSSSTSSGANDEVAEAANVTTPTMTSRSAGGSLARRSAARASAGTPETARGIVSLRQGLQRKVSTSSSSPSLARLPVSPSCLLPASQLTNNPPCQYRNKFYFTPEKSPSPSKTSGVRPGEFTPPSLFSSTTHMSSTYKFSPLVCSPSKYASIEQPFGSPASQSTSSRSSSLSTTSLCGASKRKRQATVPPRTAATKVMCNSGSSIPSFRMAKCTRLDGLVCLSSLTPSSVSLASSLVTSLASSRNSPASAPITPSRSPAHNSPQTGNQASTSVCPSSSSFTASSTNFQTVNHSHPTYRAKVYTQKLHPPHHQPIRTLSKFKQSSLKFPTWRNIKNSRTLLSTPRNCKFRNASYLKYSWKKASRPRSNFVEPSFEPCPNFNTPQSNHRPAPSVSACSSNIDHCCNMHECHSSRTNPQPVHVNPVPSSKACMFNCEHDSNIPAVQPGMCLSYLCRLQCQNNVLIRELNSSSSNSYTHPSIINTCSENSSSLFQQQNHLTSVDTVSDFDVAQTFPSEVSDVDQTCHGGVSDSDVNRRSRSIDFDVDISQKRHISDSDNDVNGACNERVFDFDVNRMFHRDASDFDDGRNHHKGVIDGRRTDHKGVSDVDVNRTYDTGVSEFGDNMTYHTGVSDFGNKRTYHKSVYDVDANRTFHSGVYDFDETRTFHEGVSDVDDDRTFHKGVSDVDDNTTFHKGVSDVDDDNRTSHKGVSNVDYNRTFHKGVSDVDNSRTFDRDASDCDDDGTFHSGVSDSDDDRTFHSGVSDLDDDRTFHKGVSDVDDSRTFHRDISDFDVSGTFRRHSFDIDRTYQENVLHFNGSMQKCRFGNSDEDIDSVYRCEAAGTVRHSADNYKESVISDSDRENTDRKNPDRENTDRENIDRESTDFTIVDAHDSNDSVKFSSVSRRKHKRHAENTDNSSFFRVRRKAKKNHYKCHNKHRDRHRLNESRKRKVKRKYRLVKEVPKVKIRIVRRHSVNTCEVSSSLIERHCNLQESAGEMDKKPSGADFQNEFLKMLQAGGMPHLPGNNESVENINCSKNVTWPVNGASHLKDFGQQMWRNISGGIDKQHAGAEWSHKDSKSYSESCPVSVCQVNHVNRDLCATSVGYNRKMNVGKAGKLLAECRERSLSDGKNHSEYVDYKKNHRECGDYLRNHNDHVAKRKNHRVDYRTGHSGHMGDRKNHSECRDYQRNHSNQMDDRKHHSACGNYQEHRSECGEYQKNHSECGDYQTNNSERRQHSELEDYQKNVSECGDYHKNHSDRRNHSEFEDYQKNHSEFEDNQKNYSEYGDYKTNHNNHLGDRRNHTDCEGHCKNRSEHIDYQRNSSDCEDYQKNDSERIDYQRNHGAFDYYQKNHNDHVSNRRNHTEYRDYQRNHSECADHHKNYGDYMGDKKSHSESEDCQRNHRASGKDHTKQMNCQRSHSNHVNYQKNHSEFGDYQTVQPGLVSNKAIEHKKLLDELSAQDKILSLNSYKSYLQLPSDDLQEDRSSATAISETQGMSNTSTKSIKEPASLADSITLRDKVISAFAKFNRKDIIVSSIEVAQASSGQPEPTATLESDRSIDPSDKLLDNEPVEKASAVNCSFRLSECCCVEEVCQCGGGKLSKEAVVSIPQEDSAAKTDSGMMLLEEESSRQMLDESMFQDKELNRLSCQIDHTRQGFSSETEARSQINPDRTVQENRLKECHHSEVQASSKALDLRTCPVQQLPLRLKASSEQENTADAECNRSTQTEALDLSEGGKDSHPTKQNPAVSRESAGENATTSEACSPTSDNAACLCSTKSLQSCNRQCMVHPNEQQQMQTTTRSDVVGKEIGTNTSTCGKQHVVTAATETSCSGCKVNNHECQTQSQNMSVSKCRTSPLFRHKTAVHLTHGGKKQLKIKMIDVGHTADKECSIQKSSANCKCHIYTKRQDLDENIISDKQSALKQAIDTGHQSLKSHLLISDHIAAQQKEPVASCVSISIQTDHGCSEARDPDLVTRNENSELEVELGGNQKSVKVQVSHCDSNVLDAAFCQGKHASSDNKDNQEYNNVITVEMSGSSQNDKKIQDSQHPCCQKQSQATGHSCIASKPRGCCLESEDIMSASRIINLSHKEKADTDQDLVDGATSSDNAKISRKIDTSPCCSQGISNNQNCSSLPQKMLSRVSTNALLAKQDSSSRGGRHKLPKQLDCYISGVSYLNDGVEKYDPEEITIQDESDDVIMLNGEIKDDVTNDNNVSLTNSSDSSVANAISDLVIDLSIHARSDSSSIGSNCDSSSSWSNCSNSSSSSENCSITSCDNYAASDSSISFPVAENFDFAESTGNTTISLNRESVFESVVQHDSVSTGLLDLRKKTATKCLSGDCISDTDLTWLSRKLTNHNNTMEKIKSTVPSTCADLNQKPCSSIYSSVHEFLHNDMFNSAQMVSQAPKNNEDERSKNLSANLKQLQKHGSLYSSSRQRTVCSSQQQGRENTAGDDTFTSHQCSEVNGNNERTYTHEPHIGESQNKGLQSSECCKGSLGIPGGQISSENSIILHSYGSLNTGEGFTVVDGKLKQCEILNKEHLRSSSTSCSRQSCHSSCRHPAAKESASTVVKHSATGNTNNTPRNSRGPSKRLDESTIRKQNNYFDRLEQLRNKMPLPYQIGNSKKQGGAKYHRDLSFYPQNNFRCGDSCSFEGDASSSLSGSLGATGNVEYLDLSKQLEEVQISNCNNPCQAVSKGYIQTLKKRVTRSDVTQFTLRPKHKQKSHQGIFQRKHMQVDLSGPCTSDKILATQKGNASSIQHLPRMTQNIKSRAPGGVAFFGQSSLSGSSGTARSGLNRNRQFAAKSCPSWCMVNTQAKHCPRSASDRTILRSSYISDLQQLERGVGPKSSYVLPYSHTNNLCLSQPVDQIMSYNPECIFASKFGRKTLTAPRKYDSPHQNCTLSSKAAMAGVNCRQVTNASHPHLDNDVTMSDSYTHTHIPVGHTHNKDMRSTALSMNRGGTLNQALQNSQHISESLSSEASVVPSAVAPASSTAFPQDHSPINLSCCGKTQESHSDDWTLEIPCSALPGSYLTNSQEENVLDVIMEELKVQIALLKEEIMRESQQQSADHHASLGRGRKSKGLTRVPLRPKGQREFLLSQRRKSYRYGLHELDHLFDFSNGSLRTAPATHGGRDTLRPHLNDFNYDRTFSGGKAMMSGHGMSRQQGNPSTSGSILTLDGTPESPRVSNHVNGNCGRMFKSEDNMLRSTDTIFRGGLTNLSVQTVEASDINLTVLAETEEDVKGYIEVSSDGED